MHLRHTIRIICAAALAAGVAACDEEPIEWKDPAVLHGDTLGRLSIDSTGQSRLVTSAEPAAVVPDIPGGVLCNGSVRTVKGTAHLYAAWWAMRTDSGATLFVAGGKGSPTVWDKPLPVDTTDESSAGCNRPAPSVTVVGDDVFVAYSLHAPEGRGVFFAHTMGGMVHEPVPVVYGERVVATAIAAEGDRVVVAYEEPNGSRRRIDVAISETQGHTFDWHVPASRDVDVARKPDVALAGTRLAVSWMAEGHSDSTPSRVVRLGRLK